MDPLSVDALRRKANRIRRHVIRMTAAAGSGHPGGALSCVDILTALYFRALHHDASRPEDPGRDRFILSKGHGCPALYAVLAESGYFDPETLTSLRRMGSPLQGHPDRRKLPILDASTGSLGQGLSIGVGMAWARRMDSASYHMWVLTGDGECDEGQIWEATLFAGHHRLDHLTLIVDANGFQLDAAVKDVLDLESLADKFAAFGWEVRTIDGHDMEEVVEALENARYVEGRPLALIARTVKGKGVSFMENDNHWHGVAPDAAQEKQALAELEAAAREMGDA